MSPSSELRPDTLVDAPAGMERRLVLRVLHHWRELCGNRRFPPPKDINMATMEDLWPHCFLLDLNPSTDDPIYSQVGAAFEAAVGHDLLKKPISTTPPNTLGQAALKLYHEVLEKKVPITRGGQFTSPHNIRVLYRSILMPLSIDGTKITHILGAANCREVTEE